MITIIKVYTYLWVLTAQAVNEGIQVHNNETWSNKKKRENAIIRVQEREIEKKLFISV